MVAEAAKPKKKQGPPSAMMLAAQNRAHEARTAANEHSTTPTPGGTTPPHPHLHSHSHPAAANAEAIGSAVLDKYVAAINAHDTSSFPDIFTESYIQHSGRSSSGIAATIEVFKGVFAATPDHQMKVEERIIAGDKVVARTTHSATHTHTFRGIPPTGKPFTYRWH